MLTEMKWFSSIFYLDSLNLNQMNFESKNLLLAFSLKMADY